MINYNEQAANDEVRYWIAHNLQNYITKNPERENQGEIEHIIDFLNSPESPRRLMKMSYAQAKKGAEKWLETQKKLGNDILESTEDTEVCIDFEDGYKLVRLKGENAYKREGYLMSHCVASYFGKDTEVLSLRDKNNMPHCTIEKSSGQFKQVKGKGNGSIHPNYINYIIKSLEFLGVSIRSSELANLGYIPLPTGYEEVALKFYKNISKATINDKEYLFTFSKSKLKV